jgi:hypothetical protein
MIIPHVLDLVSSAYPLPRPFHQANRYSSFIFVLEYYLYRSKNQPTRPIPTEFYPNTDLHRVAAFWAFWDVDNYFDCAPLAACFEVSIFFLIICHFPFSESPSFSASSVQFLPPP